MTIKELEVGIAAYVHDEIATKATGMMKFAIYAGTFLGGLKFEQLAGQYINHPLVKTLGIIDEYGDIDVDLLYEAAKAGIKGAKKVEVAGIIFDEKDVDKLYDYLKQVEVE